MWIEFRLRSAALWQPAHPSARAGQYPRKRSLMERSNRFRKSRGIGRGVASTATLSLVAGAMFMASAAEAQWLSDACRTRYGVCWIPPGPIGSTCACGPDIGRIVPPAPPQRRASSNACGTYRGVCRIPVFLPIGSQCTCYGDPGTVIP